MSKFQSVISTVAALGTIAVTAVTAYKVFDQQQQNGLKQQLIIEDLKRQLQEKKQPALPVAPDARFSQQLSTPNPLLSGSAAAPPALTPDQVPQSPSR